MIKNLNILEPITTIFGKFCSPFSKKYQMEFVSHKAPPNVSLYYSAPTSPKFSFRGITFSTAPSSPLNVPGNDKSYDLDSDPNDFEFGINWRFGDCIELEIGQNVDFFLEDQPQKQQPKMKPNRERGGSLPEMAFADELFYNGQVMPLKPPPRLQCGDDNTSFVLGSTASPKSPQPSVFKVPFVHRAAWNDDFDPFEVALEKVSGENRGSRSHWPFRMNSSTEKQFDQQTLGPKFGLPKEPKGSPYSRFVIDPNKQVEQAGKARKKIQKLPFGKRVRPLKTENEETNKTASKMEEDEEGKIMVAGNGLKKIRSILLKYASFGIENRDGKVTCHNGIKWKPSFKKLSFKVKDNASGNEKKRGIGEESKMDVIEYKRSKSSLALCFYGFEHKEEYAL